MTDIAREDLGAIYRYISDDLLEIFVANKVMNKIERSILDLKNNPYSCMEVHLKLHNKTYRRLVKNNYVVLYEVKEQYRQIVIYRVLYGRMDYLK